VSGYFVYVIWNADHQRYYVGQTENLDQRIAQHNDPGNSLSRYTKRFSGKWDLIHQEKFSTREDAMKREKALKSGQDRQWLKETVLPR
jgi:putative endonuclease